MKKNWFVFALLVSLTMMPVGALAAEDIVKESTTEHIEEELNEATISVKGNTVHVTNAEGKSLEVYNLAGMRIATVKIESEDATFNLNLTKGYYILKIGKVARKISIS